MIRLPLKNANGTQNLLTKTCIAGVPPLYSQDGKGDAAIVHLKYFIDGFTWYVLELNPETGEAFGLTDCHGEYPELGYIPLTELAKLRGGIGQGVERDLQWKPTPLGEVRAKIEERQAA